MYSVQGDSNRNLTLDFVKGILVIVMVIYHIMNYFSTAAPEEFVYVRFVSSSFIFISGYIVSTFYEKKYRLDKAGTSMRLFIRGVKLFIIFTALNVFINLTGIGNPMKPMPDVEQYLNNVTAIYFSGNRSFAAFQILLPISYLLMLSPFFLLFTGIMKTRIVIILATISCLSFVNIDSENLGLGLVGIIGFFVGLVINKLEKSFFIKNRIIILFCLFVCICLLRYLDINVITYTIGIMMILKLFYDLGKAINLNRQINQVIIFFGQYTLVCYIMQIIFLQGLFRIMSKHRWGFGYETVLIFIVTNIYLLGLCGLMKYMRGRYESMDKAYKFIFS